MKKSKCLFVHLCFLSTVALLITSLSLPQAHAALSSQKPTAQKAAQQDPPPAQEITTSKKQSRGAVKSEIGLNIPEWGVSIDAAFNPELDDIIPGYHILNIVLTNRRGEAIDLSPGSDKWVVVDKSGRKHTAFNHVNQFDKKLWEKLPPKMQKLLDYPTKVNPGKSVKIDVFLNKTIPLFNFKEIAWRSDHFDKTFNVYTTYEDKLNVPNSKEFDVQTEPALQNPEADIDGLPEDLGEDETIQPPSKFDVQNQEKLDAQINQPQEQTIVIH